MGVGSIKDLELVKHSWDELEKALDLLKTIKKENDINKLPTDKAIDDKNIKDSKVPDKYKKAGLIDERNDRKFELFKIEFEKGGASGLDDDQIKV
jgi:hypothetical protein